MGVALSAFLPVVCEWINESDSSFRVMNGRFWLTVVGHTLKQCWFLLRDISSLRQMDHVQTTGWDQRTSFNVDWSYLLCNLVCLQHFLFICSWLVLIIVSMVSTTWSKRLKSRQGWTRTHHFVHWWGDASVINPQHIHLHQVALTLSTLCVDRACLWVVESRRLLSRSWLMTWRRDTLNWVKVISLPPMPLVLWQLPVTMVLYVAYLQPEVVKYLRTQLSS